MKHLLCLFVLLFSGLLASKAQSPITLTPDSARIGNTSFPGLWLGIPEVKPEVVKAQWIKKIEKGTRSKVKIEKNDMTIFGANISEVYKGTVNIMSKSATGDSLFRLFVCVQTSPGVYISKDTPEFGKLSQYLKDFGKDQYVNLAKEQFAVENDKLREMEKDLKSARKNKEKLEKEIQTSTALIPKEKDKIYGFNKEIEATDTLIDRNTTVIGSMADGAEKKAKESELKNLEKKKKGLLRDIKSSEKSIQKANTTIEENTKEIALNVTTQKYINDKIDQQKKVAGKFEKRLNTIKGY